MLEKMSKETRSEYEARAEDYLQELHRLSDCYRRDPVIQSQQRKESVQYWSMMAVTNLVVAPLFILFLLWFSSEFNVAFDVFLNNSVTKALWVVISMTGFALSVIFIPKKPKLWNRLSMQKINSINPPNNHKSF